MEIPKITIEINLKNAIAEIREVSQALEQLADNLEHIERKFKAESEE